MWIEELEKKRGRESKKKREPEGAIQSRIFVFMYVYINIDIDRRYVVFLYSLLMFPVSLFVLVLRNSMLCNTAIRDIV